MRTAAIRTADHLPANITPFFGLPVISAPFPHFSRYFFNVPSHIF